jgi:hypothetical protein
MAGALFRRIVKVYPGVDRIDCELEISGLDLSGRLVAVSSDIDPRGRVPIVGERFGAVLAKRGRGTPGTVSQPAYRWAAAGPGDAFQAGPQATAPLRPLSIIYDGAGELLDAAKSLHSVLVQRGIPCGIVRDVPEERNPRWSDSTEYTSHNEDLRDSSDMRIVLGGPEQNLLAKSILMQAPKSVMAAFTERLAAGVCLYVDDRFVPRDMAAAPTVIIAGATAAISARLATEVGAAIRDTGHYPIAKEFFLTSTPEPVAEHGAGIFHVGPFLFSAQADGNLLLALAHGSDHTDGNGNLLDGRGLASRYAFYPFRGPWQDSAIARAAHGYAEPFQSAVTSLHVSRQPGAYSLLSLNPTSAAVTAIKPAEAPEAAASASKVAPLSDGILVRLYETTGRARHVDLAAFAPLREAFYSDIVSTRGQPLETDVNQVLVSLKPFQVASIVLAPSSRVPQGRPATLEDSGTANVVYVPYWRHNRHAGLRGVPPVALALSGALDKASNLLTVTLGNNLSDESMKGTVSLSAPHEWRLSPSHIAFHLPPRGTTSHDVVVMRKSPSGDSGGVMAIAQVRGQEYFDVLQLDPRVCDVETTVSGEYVEVRVQNLTALPAHCTVEAVTPPANWPELRPHLTAAVSPRLVTASIPPYAHERWVFRAPSHFASGALVFKVTANATVTYHVAAGSGPPAH